MSALNEIAHAVDAPSFDASFPLSSAAAILSALRAAGYAVVPVEPTGGMIEAAINWEMDPQGNLYSGIYRAMIAAAQEPQE